MTSPRSNKPAAAKTSAPAQTAAERHVARKSTAKTTPAAKTPAAPAVPAAAPAALDFAALASGATVANEMPKWGGVAKEITLSPLGDLVKAALADGKPRALPPVKTDADVSAIRKTLRSDAKILNATATTRSTTSREGFTVTFTVAAVTPKPATKTTPAKK